MKSVQNLKIRGNVRLCQRYIRQVRHKYCLPTGIKNRDASTSTHTLKIRKHCVGTNTLHAQIYQQGSRIGGDTSTHM